MYQYRSPTRFDNISKLRSCAATLLASAALITAATPAFAASSQATQTRQEISQTRLSAMRGSEVTRIDWRQPEMKLRFDLTESDWIDGIDLILAMTPQGNVSRKGPVLVSLNNSAPLKMHPYGKGFDARLRFDESFVRAKGNVITIRIPTPNGAPCLTSEHGQWDVNTKKSSIVVRTRAKSRNFYLREVADSLQNPTTAPKSVSLLAYGSDTPRLQMLAAQGIALQTPEIPNFKTTSSRSDMQVIIGRRDQISQRVSDREILSETGPKISVHKGRPMRLVITGDNDSEVLEATQAFASYKIPAVRRRETNSGEMSFQTSFADMHPVLKGRTRLNDLNQAVHAMDWRGTPNTISFNVSDPSVKSGNVFLRLKSGNKISTDSRIEVELNGQSLGFSELDRKRKSVNFEIPEGALIGVGNTLKIIPTLEMKPSVETFGQSCPSWNDVPELFIGDGSHIELTANGSSPASELSRLTSDGSLFAIDGGANTHIVLTSSAQSDTGASLELLAQLAKTSGSGWINASVSKARQNKKSAQDNGSKNMLVIGPRAGRTKLLGDAPRALTAALNGKVSSGALAQNKAGYEKFASADGVKTMQIYAAKKRAKTRIGSGGVAAVYPDGQRLIGVISSTPGRSFASTAQDLIEGDQWNSLSGSVSRWNSKTVLMAQTAIPTPQLSFPASTPALLPSFDLAWMEDHYLDASTRLADLKDTADLKMASIWSGLENRFASATPAKTYRAKADDSLAPAPVYTSKKTPSLAKAQDPSPVYKVASAAPKSASLSPLSEKVFAAPLRGFSRPDDAVKADKGAPKWMKNTLVSVKNMTAKSVAYVGKLLEPRNAKIPLTDKMESRAQELKLTASPQGEKLNAAVQSGATPLPQFEQFTDRGHGYLAILIAFALLTFALMISLILPKREK